ncbi:MAG: DUF1707 SHOCT-like domain-containing protein [Nocardioides sp.]
MDTPDRAQLRVSDAERHQVAEILRQAAGDGRIDLDELDQRLEAAYAAKTYADLVPITLDLPGHQGHALVAPADAATPSPVVRGPMSERHIAVLGGVDRKGVWVVPQELTVFAMMGGASLDMRLAKFAAQEVVITVNAFMGGADITVGPHTNVVIEGVGIMGGYAGPSDRTPAELDATSPTVRVRGVAIWGGVNVERKPLPGNGGSRRQLRRR